MLSLVAVTPSTTKADLTSAYRIHETAQVAPWSFSTFEDCFSPPYYGVLAYDGGTVVGYAIVLEVLDEATLMDIAVDANARGKGIGQTLLGGVLATSVENKMAVIWLEVRQSNLAATALYQKNGFEHIETRKNYYPTPTGKENALIMRKTCL